MVSDCLVIDESAVRVLAERDFGSGFEEVHPCAGGTVGEETGMAIPVGRGLSHGPAAKAVDFSRGQCR